MNLSKNLTILLTGVGAPGTKGTLYCLQNNPQKQKVRIIGVDANLSAVGKNFIDIFEQVPMPDHDDYVAHMIDLCRRHDVDVVLPQTTKEIFVLSKEKKQFEKEGVCIVVSPNAAIEVANNKWKLLQVFESLQLPVPRFYLAKSKEEFVEAVQILGCPDLPVATKPPVSNGMRGFRVIKEETWSAERFFSEKPSGEEISLDILLRILDTADSWPEMLVTEYLPGAEYSVDAFLGKDERTVLPRLRKVIRSGISFETVFEQHREIEEMTLKAAEAIGLQYAFGFQYKLDVDGFPKVLECNPRVQGTMIASFFTGVNLIWASIQEALGNPVEPFSQPVQESSFLRFWGGIGVSNGVSTII